MERVDQLPRYTKRKEGRKEGKEGRKETKDMKDKER
jgi:hypothetical protein